MASGVLPSDLATHHFRQHISVCPECDGDLLAVLCIEGRRLYDKMLDSAEAQWEMADYNARWFQEHILDIEEAK